MYKCNVYTYTYSRMKGKQVLFPFAFHCTGMPIQAAANKLKRELEEEKSEASVEQVAVEVAAVDVTSNIGQFKGKKSKLTTKTGGMGTKEILLKTGIPPEGKWSVSTINYFSISSFRVSRYFPSLLLDDFTLTILFALILCVEIENFVDPLHWLQYFPPLGMKDLKRFGVHVDWRRSFITTSG